jgi:hypothetical protein
MRDVASLLVVLVVVLAALVLVTLAFGWVWRLLPLGQRLREVTFVQACGLVLTPVPVGVGVGAMIYPLAVLYKDRAQLAWHFERWYLPTPWLFFPSLGITFVVAYVVMHRVFGKTRHGR